MHCCPVAYPSLVQSPVAYTGRAYGYSQSFIVPMPKFSLRDLFAVVTIVALALGWVIDHVTLATRLSRAESKLELIRQGAMPSYVLWGENAGRDQPSQPKR